MASISQEITPVKSQHRIHHYSFRTWAAVVWQHNQTHKASFPHLHPRRSPLSFPFSPLILWFHLEDHSALKSPCRAVLDDFGCYRNNTRSITRATGGSAYGILLPIGGGFVDGVIRRHPANFNDFGPGGYRVWTGPLVSNSTSSPGPRVPMRS